MKLTPGTIIPMKALSPLGSSLNDCPANLVNDYGLQLPAGPDSGCECSKNGLSMWLVRGVGQEISLLFDTGRYVPAGRLLVWNYNRRDPVQGTDFSLCGLRKVRVFYSIDARCWQELDGSPFVLAKATGEDGMKATNLESGETIDFGGVTLRYLKICADPEPGVGNYDTANAFRNSFGLAKIMLLAGEGLQAEPAGEWTELFQRRNGWAGGDGIYSCSLNGLDCAPSAADTFITFGDTLIGARAADGTARTAGTVMINNSVCVLHGSDPATSAPEFQFGTGADGAPRSVFLPDEQVWGELAGRTFFWLQDGVVIGDRFYCVPMLVREEPQNPEGYQFAIEYTALLEVPIHGGAADWKAVVQRPFDLMHTFEDGSQLIFGGAIFANTQQAGAPDPDGFVYLYGHRPQMGTESLYVCRVPADRFADRSQYVFYAKNGWSASLEEAEPLCSGVSCEMSLSPYFGSLHKGKYIFVYQELVNSPVVCCRIADSPAGPFHAPVRLYECPEPAGGRSVYTYNAKGHPHLSPKGSLLVSYNVNACNWDVNMRDASIYSPRFLHISEVSAR